jgi:signal transduction histidine kinase
VTPFQAAVLRPLPIEGLWLLAQQDVTTDPMVTNVLISLLIFTALLTLAAWIAARQGVRPLQALQHGARRVARGDHAFRLEVPSEKELAALARDFNAMAEQVAARELELEEKNGALARASTLKTMLLANVSHELRTPLTAVIGFADLLRDGIKGPVNEAQRELLDKLRTNARGLQALIDDLLDVSRIEAGQLELNLESVPVAEVLEAACSAVEPQLSPAVAFRVEVPEEPLVVRGDYRRLVQVFVNLLGNAVKFTPTGEIRVSATAAADRATVTVSDTGIGIEPAALPHVFEPFRQGDGGINRRYGGAGLGLAITRRIVELHGGTIEVESRPGQGTRFTVRLPGR